MKAVQLVYHHAISVYHHAISMYELVAGPSLAVQWSRL